jgi:hypothetical protein
VVRPGEEVRHCLREIPQCLLLHHLGSFPQPRVVRASGGELSALLQVSRCARLTRPPVGVLLDREIPHVPSVSAVPQQDCLLLSGRAQPVS